MLTDQCETFIEEKTSIHKQYYVSKTSLSVTLYWLNAYEVTDTSAVVNWTWNDRYLKLTFFLGLFVLLILKFVITAHINMQSEQQIRIESIIYKISQHNESWIHHSPDILAIW